MAGTSGTPLVRKLGIRPGSRVLIVDPPRGFAKHPGPLPAAGLVDNKICAVDDVWSGLRFVIRVKDRSVRANPA